MEKEKINSGPHLSGAFLCERVLQEKDNVPSFIRVAERFTVAGPMPEMPPAAIQTNIVVSMKAGSLGSGSYRVKVRVMKPDGDSFMENEVPIFFEGGEDQGPLIVMPTIFNVKEQGLYWIDVLFEGALMSRIPFRVLYQRIGQISMPSAGL